VTAYNKQSALYAIARLSVCLSVRLTGGLVKTVEVRTMQLSPQTSSIPLVIAL